MMRLQKYLASCGIASRRNAEAIIEAGRVEVNGRTAALGDKVDPAVDAIACDGKPVQAETPVYIVLNKPKGVVTTAEDTHDRRTVLDCVAGVKAHVFPVGRLDLDVEGALLLTNDGDLAQRLMHPRYEVDKVYLAVVEGKPSREAIAQLQNGIPLEDGMTAAAKVSVVNARGDTTLIRLTLHEGRKREVKRMCTAVGHPVLDLQRVAVAGIEVKGLRPGEWRYLTPHEIAALQRHCRR